MQRKCKAYVENRPLTERDVADRLWLSERLLREVRMGLHPSPPPLPRVVMVRGLPRYMFRDVDDYWGTPDHLDAIHRDYPW